jgi:uncharacterized DUF497 family protein
MEVPDLSFVTGFEWDDGNRTKNREKHRVSQAECEQVFFNAPLLLFPDVRHSQTEPRYYVLGRTHAGRHLFVVFTVRGSLIRVISARDMSRKERKVYEQAEESA